MEKINKLKKTLKKIGLDGYIIPKNDEFFGEYIQDHKDRLKFITEFTGSFGLALILKQKNFLFVDGRYTLQARIQSGKDYEIKTFPESTPSSVLKNKKKRIGYDPKLMTKNTLNFFFKNTFSELIPIEFNLIDQIWKRDGLVKRSKFYHLPDKIVGLTSKKKLEKITINLKKKKVDYQFISSSENIAWLLNIRGKDSKYTPVPNCHALLNNKKEIILFCDLNKISLSFRKKFKNVRFISETKIEYILDDIKNKSFIIDQKSCSIFFENKILLNNKILCRIDPIYFLKSIKQNKEINNIKKVHIEDGIALTKYLFWVKKNFLKKKITEISGEKKLLELRKKNKSFKFSSFPTISGTGANGAIVHYKANKNTNKKLRKGDIYLVDSGGQYNYGTTDVTRTISLHNNSRKIKDIFTRVLKGHIAVASYKLNNKTSGKMLDKVARKYLKEKNLDYAHGTGHGVGYFLNVHEGPQAITNNNLVHLKEGMIVSNEPGFYANGKFGIRIENLIYVKRYKKKLIFENFTLVPIDKNLIDLSIMKKNEINWLNAYHKKVFSYLKNFMTKEENIYLKQACSAI